VTHVYCVTHTGDCITRPCILCLCNSRATNSFLFFVECLVFGVTYTGAFLCTRAFCVHKHVWVRISICVSKNLQKQDSQCDAVCCSSVVCKCVVFVWYISICVSKNLQKEFARICKNLQEFARICKNLQKFAKARQPRQVFVYLYKYLYTYIPGLG